jgi:hypothetical protein
LGDKIKKGGEETVKRSTILEVLGEEDASLDLQLRMNAFPATVSS